MKHNRPLLSLALALMLAPMLACGVTLRAPDFLGRGVAAATPSAGDAARPIAPADQPAAPSAGFAPTPTAIPDAERGQVDQEERLLVNLYQRLNPSVVFIQVTMTTTGRGGGTVSGSGSGFVLDTKGNIATNNHVIAGATQIGVRFSDGTTAKATLVGADTYSDLAVIKVDVPASQLVPVVLGDSSTLRAGQKVLALGNPFGLEGSMTTGIVSAIGRTLTEGGTATTPGFSNPEIIQTDAAINPGNSGGPLFDYRGRVVGVNSAIRTTSTTAGSQPANSGVGFAVPVNTVKRVIPQLMGGGQARYPYLGVSLSAINAPSDQPNAIKAGAQVSNLVAGEAAERAGLKVGDIITAFNGQAVKDPDAMIALMLATTMPGDVATLSVSRGGKMQDIKVTLGERPR
ncbi:MAG: trypsin-like peptidase domain-containing protein [Thermoflexales bacterium]|nr:trypsin-like peptidase domain-containing protein [Thermoflexales bacterium]